MCRGGKHANAKGESIYGCARAFVIACVTWEKNTAILITTLDLKIQKLGPKQGYKELELQLNFCFSQKSQSNERLRCLGNNYLAIICSPMGLISVTSYSTWQPS